MIFSKCGWLQEPASEYWNTPPQTGSISAIAASSVCRARLVAVASPASARVIARSMLSASMYFWFSPQPPSLSSQDSSKFFVSSARASLVRNADVDRLDLKGFADRRARRGIVDDGLEQRLHPLRLDIAPDLGDLGAVGAEHDRRRPAPVAVAARQIGIGVLVDANRQIFRGQQILNLGVRIGGLFHHVAPVAPHRLEIEDHEALFGRGAGEQIVVPAAPFGPSAAERGRCRKGGNGKAAMRTSFMAAPGACC